mgnify:CR=1 FL=1
MLFTPRDRKAIMELLRVGKRLEQDGVVFVDLWPNVLSFCGRGWFDTDEDRKTTMMMIAPTSVITNEDVTATTRTTSTTTTSVTVPMQTTEDEREDMDENSSSEDDMDYLALPTFR